MLRGPDDDAANFGSSLGANGPSAQPPPGEGLLAERAQQERLLHLLTHDLRNPMASASMAIASLMRQESLTPKGSNKAQRALAALARADLLLTRFSDLRRLGRGEALPIDRQPSSPATALERAVVAMGPRGRDRIQMEAAAAGQGLWDIAYLSRAIEELLDNALRYGAAAAPISLRLLAVSGGQAIEVRSQGDCADVSEQPAQLGVAPWQPRSADLGQPGWGFGLRFVQHVCLQHGGQLWVHVRNQEICFSLQFPAYTVGRLT